MINLEENILIILIYLEIDEVKIHSDLWDYLYIKCYSFFFFLRTHFYLEKTTFLTLFDWSIKYRSHGMCFNETSWKIRKKVTILYFKNLSNVMDVWLFSTYNEVNISPIIQKNSFLRVLPDFMSFSFLILIFSNVEIHWNINGKNVLFCASQKLSNVPHKSKCSCKPWSSEDLKIIVYKWKKS